MGVERCIRLDDAIQCKELQNGLKHVFGPAGVVNVLTRWLMDDFEIYMNESNRMWTFRGQRGAQRIANQPFLSRPIASKWPSWRRKPKHLETVSSKRSIKSTIRRIWRRGSAFSLWSSSFYTTCRRMRTLRHISLGYPWSKRFRARTAIIRKAARCGCQSNKGLIACFCGSIKAMIVKMGWWYGGGDRNHRLRVQEKPRLRITLSLRRDSRSFLETSQIRKVCERLWELDSATTVILFLRFKHWITKTRRERVLTSHKNK
jgi:hypothetical protein